MGRLRFVAGAFGIVLGFSVYQYGFFLTLGLSDSLASWTMSYVPWMGAVAILGAVMQLIGGAIAIVGLLICVSWIGSQSRVAPPPIVSRRVAKAATQIPDSVPKCRFCGVIIESGAAFCPSCQRAQA